jgi:hypothetical protein
LRLVARIPSVPPRKPHDLGDKAQASPLKSSVQQRLAEGIVKKSNLLRRPPDSGLAHRTMRRRALLSPNFHIEVRHNPQLEAQIEQRAAQSVEHMLIVGHTQEGNLHDAIDGRDFA